MLDLGLGMVDIAKAEAWGSGIEKKENCDYAIVSSISISKTQSPPATLRPLKNSGQPKEHYVP
jgi:hypothetical protein